MTKKIIAISIATSVFTLFMAAAWVASDVQSAISGAENRLEAISQNYQIAMDNEDSCMELPSAAQPDCFRRVWDKSISSGTPSSAQAVSWLEALSGPALAISSEESIREATRLGLASALSESEWTANSSKALRAACSGAKSMLCPASAESVARSLDGLRATLSAKVDKASSQATSALARRASQPSPASTPAQSSAPAPL